MPAQPDTQTGAAGGETEGGVYYTLRQGDCITSVAASHGLFWRTVWQHANNAELRQRREDPNILVPGDVVFIPEKRQRPETGATEMRHRFRKKGTPAKLRLRLMREPEREQRQSHREPTQYPPPRDLTRQDPQSDAGPVEDEPRANVPYVVVIDGDTTEGRTDSDGKLEVSIPPGASSGRLIIEPGTPQEATVPIRLGHLNPIDTVSGVKQRLANLTFDCGDVTDEETETYAAAVRAFQEKHGLEATGEVDDATRQKLREAHGD